MGVHVNKGRKSKRRSKFRTTVVEFFVRHVEFNMLMEVIQVKTKIVIST